MKTSRGGCLRGAACTAWLAFWLGLSLATGCKPASDSKPAGVRLVLVDHAGLMVEVAKQRGRVVVLDCWSTSCPPCVREFPKLIALQKKLGNAVCCLSLSFDYEGIGTPEQAMPRVQRFLEQVNAHQIVNLLSQEEADTMYRQLDLASIPAVYVWQADGSLAQRFDGDDATQRLGRPFTYDDVEAVVRRLLLK